MRKLLLIAAVFSCSVTFGQNTIVFQDFEGGADDWAVTESPASYNVSGDVWANVTSVGSISGPSNGSNFWGMQDLENGNGGGAMDHTLTFASTDISTFSNVQISFDYQTIGFDATDELKYELIEDGVAQGQVALDKNTGEWVTVTLSTSATSTISLILSGIQNGGSDYAGFDNVILSGIDASAEVVGFGGLTSTETETNSTFSITRPVTLANYGGIQVDLSVSVTGGTAEAGDYTLNTTSLSFTSSTSQNVSIDINPDSDFSDETIEITIVETSATGLIVSPAVHTITVEDDDLPDLVINEFLADPDATNGDANGDGIVDTSEDEFVEIVNTGLVSFDMSDWVVADASGDRHVFATNTILNPGQAVVVFGGGAPSGSFGGAIVQVASAGFTGFNNGGDDIIIKTPDGTEVISITYGGEAGNNESITLSPDLTGVYTAHSTADTGDNSLFSPGTKIDGTSFESGQSVTWDGSEADNDWNNPANWDTGTIPTANDNVIIAATASDPIISDGIYAAVNDLTVNSGAVLSVDTGGSLAIFGTSTINGSCFVERGLTGSLGYSIIGSPVTSLNTDDLGATHVFGYTNPTGYSSNLNSTTSAMAPGEGYFAAYSDASPFPVFSGTPNSGDVTYSVTASSGFELISNPYTAAVSTSSFLVDNTTVITGGVYFWDDGGSNSAGDRTGDYISVTAVGTASAVQPNGSDDGVAGASGVSGADNGFIPSVQGVFVEVQATGDITFSPSQISTSTSSNSNGNHYRTTDFSKVKIAIEGNGLYNEVLVALSDAATFGRDQLFDARKFVTDNPLSFYTLLDEERFVIQALPLEAQAVQLGFDLKKAGEYSLSVVSMDDFQNLSIKDKLTGQVYDLNSTTSFEFFSEAVTNDQRFELIFTSQAVLGLESALANLKVYGAESGLNVEYQAEGPKEVAIYDLSGKLSFYQSVHFVQNSALINPILEAGKVYILKVDQESIKFILK